MTELEKVEKLREKADVSFAEAKEALDISNGDILDALIYLEKRGKSTIPAGGGYFSSADGSSLEWQSSPDDENGNGYHQNQRYSSESFGEMLKRFGRFCIKMIKKGNSNFLEADKNGNQVFSCPVTVVVLFVIFFFWVTIPLFILSLFFGLRYRFRGADLGRESVNRVMDSATEIVDDVKKSFSNNIKNPDNSDDTGNADSTDNSDASGGPEGI